MALNSDAIPFAWIGLLALMLTACDGLEQFVDETDRVPTTSLPTITAFICPQDTVLRVRVETTLPAVGTLPQGSLAGQAIAGATVTLSDGFRTATLRQDAADFGIYKIRANQLPIEGGKTYSLTVVLPDGRTATAATAVPVRPVDRTTVSIDRGLSTPNTDVQSVNVRWRDQSGEPNYYALYYYYYSYNRGDRQPSSSYYEDIGFYADTDRDGLEFTSRSVEPNRDVSSPNGYSRSVFFLCLTDKLYYDYHRALEAARFSKDNPFADPARIPTNVQGGWGLFVGYNRLDLFPD